MSLCYADELLTLILLYRYTVTFYKTKTDVLFGAKVFVEARQMAV